MTQITFFPRDSAVTGLFAGLGAFLLWGGLVMYWHVLAAVPSSEILAHRMIWSLVAVTPMVYFSRRFAEVRAALASPEIMLRITVSALIIAGNWGLYIWAVTQGHVLEASLGYYINPLANVLLGTLFLHERPSRLQCLAIAIAACGVLWSVVKVGTFPWIGLSLAGTFALYGFCRKTVRVESVPGLFLETVILFPMAAAWLMWLYSQGESHFLSISWQVTLLLMGTGLATSIPLLLFAYAARHMQLSTLGLLQYLSPTITFLIGVFVLGETITADAMVTFACIWVALGIYTFCAVRSFKKPVKDAHNA